MGERALLTVSSRRKQGCVGGEQESVAGCAVSFLGSLTASVCWWSPDLVLDPGRAITLQAQISQTDNRNDEKKGLLE